MSTLSEREAHTHMRSPERITAQGSIYSARIVEVDSMQLRFELSHSARPAPLRGRLQVGRRLGVWTLLAGTFLDVAELARQERDDAQELEGEIRRVARRYVARIEDAVGGQAR